MGLLGKAMEERTWRKGEFWDESGTPNVTSQQQVQDVAEEHGNLSEGGSLFQR